MTHTDTPYPVKGTTAKKWNKGRAGLNWIWEQLEILESVEDPIAYIDSLSAWDVRLDTGHGGDAKNCRIVDPPHRNLQVGKVFPKRFL